MKAWHSLPVRQHVRRKRRCSLRTAARSGMTLIEILIATTLTLILMLAVMEVFDWLGESISESRATLELSGQLRSVADRLQRDLDGLTVEARPWAEPNDSAGYLEIYEGRARDFDPDASGFDAGTGTYPTNPGPNNLDQNIGVSATAADIPPNLSFGDGDDYIAFTARSVDQPFRGRLGFRTAPGAPVTTRTIESPEAEIIWYTAIYDLNKNNVFDADDRYIIYRRTLLIRPDLYDEISRLPETSGEIDDIASFLQKYDISVRLENRKIVPNTLADLTKRENRFLHSTDFPHQSFLRSGFDIASGGINRPRNNSANLVHDFVNDDMMTDPNFAGNVIHTLPFIMMTQCIGFDVQVYDPHAPILLRNGEALTPQDHLYRTAINDSRPTQIGAGAFVDMGYLGGAFADYTPQQPFTTPFSSEGMMSLTRLGFSRDHRFGLYRTYDTWSTHYEHDGIDQDRVIDGSRSIVDQGTNKRDDELSYNGSLDRRFGVDDVTERETSPPYPVPLRGIRVLVRGYEPGTRQVRQVSVMTDFVPE